MGQGLEDLAKIVTVIPDITGLDREFDYSVNDSLAWNKNGVPVGFDQLEIGTVVNITIHNRKARGWIVDKKLGSDREVIPLTSLYSIGPNQDTVELCKWAAFQYGGPIRSFLVAGSPKRKLIPSEGSLSRPKLKSELKSMKLGDEQNQIINEIYSPNGAVASPKIILRLPPKAGSFWLIQAMVERSPLKTLLVVLGNHNRVHEYETKLTNARISFASPDALFLDHAKYQVVMGLRNAAFARIENEQLGGVLVIESDAYSLKSDRAPTWDASEVLLKRCEMANVPCVLVSSVPKVTQLSSVRLHTIDRTRERSLWPAIHITDANSEDPVYAPFGPDLTEIMRDATRSHQVLVIWNKLGKVRSLVCKSCHLPVTCPNCRSSLVPSGEGSTMLTCELCGFDQAKFCQKCGSTKLANYNRGVLKVREELEKILGPTKKVSVVTKDNQDLDGEVIVGTNAVLSRVDNAFAVVWPDIDREILMPNILAVEELMSNLAQAARICPSRAQDGSGGIFVRTRFPDHPVIKSLLLGDPGIIANFELERRKTLDLPPFKAVAEISGVPIKIKEYNDLISKVDLLVLGPSPSGSYLLKANSDMELSQSINQAKMSMKSSKGVRIAVGSIS
ncbi:MAG: hypothetical protein HKL80_11015 [Acidimicrobiales bacterium]|nr:hypothetical protein [Acidimicrobiales bacterium]